MKKSIFDVLIKTFIFDGTLEYRIHEGGTNDTRTVREESDSCLIQSLFVVQ